MTDPFPKLRCPSCRTGWVVQDTVPHVTTDNRVIGHGRCVCGYTATLTLYRTEPKGDQ